ncbi:MAG: 3'-5' exonuclease, partial [Opitutaceae bacterium]
MPKPWTDQPIYFVDFEGSRTSGILEFGVVEVVHGAIPETHTRLCHAMGPVRPEDSAVHGLKEPQLAAAA